MKGAAWGGYGANCAGRLMSFQGTGVLHLRTSRLHLRPLTAQDSDAIFAIMSDAEAMRFWDVPAVADRETVTAIVGRQIADMDAGRAIYWAVALDDEGIAIGSCDLSEMDHHHRRAELGFLFHRAWRGRGFAREAMGAIVDHAFGALALERLWARFHAGNERSQRLLDALGFINEGRLRGHVRRDGASRDSVLMGRLRG